MTQSSTRSTSAASPTGTGTGSATSPGSVPGSATCGPGRGRDLDQPLVPLADGRRAGTTSSDYRDVEPRFGTLRTPRRCSPRRTSAGLRVLLDIVPNHTLGPARVVRRGAGAGPGVARRVSATCSAPAAAPTASSRPTTGSPCSAGRPGAGHRARRHTGRVVPAPVRPRAAGPQLGAPRRRRRLRATPALLVRPRRRRLPDRRRALADQAGGAPRRRGHGVAAAAGRGRRRAAPRPVAAAPVLGPGRGARGLPRAGARSRTPTTTPGCSSPRPGSTSPSGWPATCAPTSCTPPFNFTYLAGPVGRRLPAARDRRRPSTSTAPSGRRPPGCCPTTTSPGTCPATPGSRPTPGSSVDAAARPAGRPRARAARRARAAVLLTLGLPGGAYVYQGEELGLPEVEDLPEERARTTRPGSAPGTPTGAATAAGCRSRGPAPGRRTASARRARRGAVAAAAGGLGRPHGGGRVGRPGLDARAVPRRAAAAPGDAGARRRLADLARPARRGCSGSPASRGWPAW